MKRDATIYQDLTRQIIAAGFFVQPPHEEETLQRICPATKYQPGFGYSGNSFWIAAVGEQWFVGTWGGMLYKSHAPTELGQFTIEWFNHMPNGTASDFEPWIVQKYHLELFDNDQFDQLLENDH